MAKEATPPGFPCLIVMITKSMSWSTYTDLSFAPWAEIDLIIEAWNQRDTHRKKKDRQEFSVRRNRREQITAGQIGSQRGDERDPIPVEGLDTGKTLEISETMKILARLVSLRSTWYRCGLYE